MSEILTFDWLVCAFLMGLCVLFNLLFFVAVYNSSKDMQELARAMKGGGHE